MSPLLTLVKQARSLEETRFTLKIRECEQRVLGEQSARGLGVGTGTLHAVRAAYLELAKTRADGLVIEIRRILAAANRNLSEAEQEEIRTQMKSDIGGFLDAAESALKALKRRLGNSAMFNCFTLNGESGPLAARMLHDIELLFMENRNQNNAGINLTGNTYHLHGPNSRVNVNTTDNSLNIAAPSDLFAALRTTFRERVQEKEQQQKILSSIDSLEKANGTSDVVGAYKEFIAVCADHLTLLTPFLPALADLLR